MRPFFAIYFRENAHRIAFAILKWRGNQFFAMESIRNCNRIIFIYRLRFVCVMVQMKGNRIDCMMMSESMIPIKCVLRYISIAHFGNLNNFAVDLRDSVLTGKHNQIYLNIFESICECSKARSRQ